MILEDKLLELSILCTGGRRGLGLRVEADCGLCVALLIDCNLAELVGRPGGAVGTSFLVYKQKHKNLVVSQLPP